MKIRVHVDMELPEKWEKATDKELEEFVGEELLKEAYVAHLQQAMEMLAKEGETPDLLVSAAIKDCQEVAKILKAATYTVTRNPMKDKSWMSLETAIARQWVDPR